MSVAVTSGLTSVPVSSEDVRRQVADIGQSPGFSNAARIRRFLGFIVEETLAGRAHQLCEYSIGVSVFDRSPSFEPGLDAIVRNDARRLRTKLLEYYQQPVRRTNVAVYIEVPKGAYVPRFTLMLPAKQRRLYSCPVCNAAESMVS
jgi:hypothetical protein